MSKSLLERLNLPFSYDNYGVNYEGQVYISAQSVVERLNEEIGLLYWEMEPLSIEVNPDYKSVSILGELRIYNPQMDRWISRRQFGNDTMTIKRDETDPTGQAFEDAKKSAMTDALKKCASWFGVASDVYSNRLSAISSKHPAYETVLNHYNLNRRDNLNGIVVLPDSYKEYYNNMGWFGVFESDIATLLGNQKKEGTNTKSQASSSQNSSNSSGGNAPLPYRILVKDCPVLQQDGTVKFKALMEDSTLIQVIVPSDKSKFALSIPPASVINVKGWLNEKTGFLRLGKANIEIETRGSSSRTA